MNSHRLWQMATIKVLGGLNRGGLPVPATLEQFLDSGGDGLA